MARLRPFDNTSASCPWPWLLEGQQRLRQLRAVGTGGHDRKEHRAVHVHQGRGLRFGPERCAHQQPDLPFAAAAERQVLSPAADAVHRRGECQHFGCGGGGPVRQPRQRPAVVTPVSRRSRGRAVPDQDPLPASPGCAGRVARPGLSGLPCRAGPCTGPAGRHWRACGRGHGVLWRSPQTRFARAAAGGRPGALCGNRCRADRRARPGSARTPPGPGRSRPARAASPERTDRSGP